MFFGSWKMDPNRTDIGPYSPSASYEGIVNDDKQSVDKIMRVVIIFP